MNNLIRFRMKMLIVLTFCVFMTFSMLVYVVKQTKTCEDSEDGMCFHMSKYPVFKVSYDFYKGQNNVTQMTYQLLKPSAVPQNLGFRKTTTVRLYNQRIRTTRDIPKNFNISANEVLKNVGYNESEKVSNSVTKPRTTESSSRAVEQTPFNFDYNVGGNHSLVYQERRETLQRFCHKYFDMDKILKKKKLRLNNILIDEKHKILFCYVPKVACTNWKRVFLVLTGKFNSTQVIKTPASRIHNKNLFKTLNNRTASDLHKLAQEYKTFIFVRHPFERLLSAFRNKFEQNYDSSRYFQARFGKQIIKKFRKNPTNVSLATGDDVTFAEFVRFLVSSDPRSYNEHWQTFTDLCHPCLINYDFIGKYETLNQDSDFILKYFGLDITFPNLTRPSTTASNLKKYFNTLGKTTIYKLYDIYQMDFRLFNYDLFNTTDWLNNT